MFLGKTRELFPLAAVDGLIVLHVTPRPGP